MIKKFLKSLVTMESIFSLIGLINTFLGFTNIIDMSLLIRIVMSSTGLIIIIYIVYTFMQSLKISNFITNNEDRYLQEIRPLSISIDKKKDWMFLELSKKFPKMTCISIRKNIDTHYKLNGDSIYFKRR